MSFLIASIFSGLAIGFPGMFWTLVSAVALTVLVLIHLWTIDIPEKGVVHGEEHTQRIDIQGAIRAIQEMPGLFALIFFNTFNNFLGGVFMSLSDNYQKVPETVEG